MQVRRRYPERAEISARSVARTQRELIRFLRVTIISRAIKEFVPRIRMPLNKNVFVIMLVTKKRNANSVFQKILPKHGRRSAVFLQHHRVLLANF